MYIEELIENRRGFLWIGEKDTIWAIRNSETGKFFEETHTLFLNDPNLSRILPIKKELIRNDEIYGFQSFNKLIRIGEEVKEISDYQLKNTITKIKKLRNEKGLDMKPIQIYNDLLKLGNWIILKNRGKIHYIPNKEFIYANSWGMYKFSKMDKNVLFTNIPSKEDNFHLNAVLFPSVYLSDPSLNYFLKQIKEQ